MKLNKKTIAFTLALSIGVGACGIPKEKEVGPKVSLNSKMDYSKVPYKERSIYVDYQHGAITKEEMTEKQADSYEKAKKILEKDLNSEELKELNKQREERREKFLKKQEQKKVDDKKKTEEDALKYKNRQERLDNHKQEKERKELQKRNEENADEMKRQLEGLSQ
ncbi:DNA ligase [Bacillus cereus group sp. MYBK227-2]|uniref:DNA ligase n=1 Tax=Bacillus cereus group sp. MYBK227-2 TaxID=3450653 RepID=UPI003F79590B